MSKTSPYGAEHRQQLLAFAESLYSGGDPHAIRLMDEMRMVSHQIYRLSEASLEAAELSYAQYRLLMNLSFEEWRGNHEGLNPSEISDHQGTSRNTISALIRGLEERGLIERQLDSKDRRRFNIHLTDAGRRRVSEPTSAHMQLVGDIFATLTPDERQTLSGLLRKLNRCVAAIKEQTTDSGGSHASNRQ